MATVQPDSVAPLRSARSWGERFVRTRDLRGALARRVRRASPRLRDHRAARLRPRGRARAARSRTSRVRCGRSSSSPSVTFCWRSSRSGSAATRCGGSSAPRSVTAPRGPTAAIERLGALGSGIVYALMCVLAVQILHRARHLRRSAKKTASDVFGWPAGRWLVGLAGLVLAGVAIYQFIRGVRQKFLDDSKTEQMPPCGHAVVHGPRNRRPRRARGRLRAGRRLPRSRRPTTTRRTRRSASTARSAKLYNGAYGSWLLGAVAAGLIAFSCFSLVEARYRRI